MPSVNRWVLDDGAGETYTVPINPNKMTKLKAPRAITTKVTTAVNGQTLLFEARRPPQQWNFSGVIRQKIHYDKLDYWVFNKGRIQITDHFLRKISVVLTDFDATPKRSIGVYWRHDYVVTGLVYDVDENGAVADDFMATTPPDPVGNTTPGALASGAQVYQFLAASTQWYITHALGHRPIVEIIDATGQLFPSIDYPDDTHVVVTFRVPTSGYAVLI